jgi:hypothetical protein
MNDRIRLRWPVDKPIVTQNFGANPDFYEPFGLPGHEGLDLFAPMNANVYAAADGQVYQVGHPPEHPYGLHIRIKHELGGKVYRTIYAHLAQTPVSVDQRVRAGELIGLADNTGNSFGSHLHLTLKIDGTQTPGYPPRIVDPWPFFQEAVEDQPPVSALIIYPITRLTLRAGPTIHSTRLAILEEGEPLRVLGDADAARARVGQEGQWMHVRTQADLTGHVAAWFVRLTGKTAPPSSLVVFPTTLLNVRARPSTTGNRLTTASPDDALRVLGNATSARAKIGDMGQWLNVKTPSGHTGYVAAWFVRAAESTSPPEPPPDASRLFAVFPTANLNFRARPSTDSPRVGGAFFNQPLTVLENDAEAARAKVGLQGQWLFVETEDGEQGWAAAWFLSLTPT